MNEPAPNAAAPATAPASPPPRSLFKRAHGALVAIAAVGAMLGGLAGYWNFWRVLKPATTADSSARPASSPQAGAPVDRRMTFAVLPFVAPRDDLAAQQLATSTHDAVQAGQEARSLWAWTTPAALVGEVTAKPQSMRDTARALDVHFLLRGTVVPGNPPAVDLAVIDGSNEQVIANQLLKVPQGGPTAVPASAVEDALARLTYMALRVEVARARDKPDASLDARDLTWRAYVEFGDHNAEAPAAT